MRNADIRFSALQTSHLFHVTNSRRPSARRRSDGGATLRMKKEECRMKNFKKLPFATPARLHAFLHSSFCLLHFLYE